MKSSVLVESHFVGSRLHPVFGNGVLKPLTNAAGRAANSRIGKRAVEKFGPVSQEIIRHLSSNAPLEEKLRRLPHFPAVYTPYMMAVRQVAAFAILCRLEEYCEQERQRSGLRRRFINAAGIDLLRVLEERKSLDNEVQFLAVIESEARAFLCFIANQIELATAVRQCTDVFRIIASEAAESKGKIEVD